MRRMAMTAVFILGAAVCGHAHGAKEYIAIDNYNAVEKGEASFYIQFDYMVRDKNDPAMDRWEITPGFSYALADNLDFDVHTHFAKFGNEHIAEEEKSKYAPLGPSPFMEAAAFKLQYNLAQTRAADIALALGYEMPFGRAKDLLDAADVLEGTLILGKYFGVHSNITLNITGAREDGETEFEWAAGFSTPLSRDPHGIAGGIEVFNNFDMDDWSVLLGICMPVGSENTVFKTGMRFGDDSIRVTTALMYGF